MSRWFVWLIRKPITWGLSVLGLSLAVLALVLTRTAGFLELLVWMETNGKESIVATRPLDQLGWNTPTHWVITTGKDRRSTQRRTYVWRGLTLIPVDYIDGSTFKLVHNARVESGETLLVVRKNCPQQKNCFEDIAYLTDNWEDFHLAYQWNTPGQVNTCTNKRPTQRRYFNRSIDVHQSELMQITREAVLDHDGRCVDQIQSNLYVVQEKKLVPTSRLFAQKS